MGIAAFTGKLACGLLLAAALASSGPGQERQPLPTPRQMADSREDLWAEAAIKQPGGPSYEFFAPLLPPLRYVNTAFRHYPIVLSAPGAPVKARWVSDGSGVNLRADKPPMWREIGTPVEFFVGADRKPFGADPAHLSEPALEDGYLPILQLQYEHAGTKYDQQALAVTRGAASEYGAVLVRFRCPGKAGIVSARIGGDDRLTVKDSRIENAAGQSLTSFGPPWRWDSDRRSLVASLAAEAAATLLIATQPSPEPLPDKSWNAAHAEAVADWRAILARGTQLTIPEPLVQDAWRALVLGNYAIASGDQMNYSAGNAYDHLYEGECGDAARSLMLFGQQSDARRMIGPLLDFQRQATRFHVAGHKLQLLTHYYWVTRDAEYLREKRGVWEPVASFIRTSRQPEHGLLPKDNYAGDIPQQVWSLSSNSNCWRGLRDLGAVLEDCGEKSLAAELRREATEYRAAILAAVEKSINRSTQPPFIPIALLGDEPAHDPLTATRMGSYYDLMTPYVLGSGVFGPGDQREQWLIDYFRRHGGLAMGMIRSQPHQGEFQGQPGVNVLYGQRYMLTLLRRGDREHALAGFYGHLAQGMTRGTFIGGEGSRFFHGDERGRSFYLPPNSASNAMFLTTLRYLLVQDWDLDDDGEPETLRLFDAIPPRWLADGQTLAAQRLPTAFGELSFRAVSQFADRRLHVTLELPPRPAERVTLRLPNPPGHKIESAQMGGRTIAPDAEGRFDLRGAAGRSELVVTVRKD